MMEKLQFNNDRERDFWAQVFCAYATKDSTGAPEEYADSALKKFRERNGKDED